LKREIEAELLAPKDVESPYLSPELLPHQEPSTNRELIWTLRISLNDKSYHPLTEEIPPEVLVSSPDILGLDCSYAL
jgi:hypothetical protein